MSIPENGSIISAADAPVREKDFLYTVLNLPSTASDHEIRERYRSLSVLFHPDKQHDDRTKGTASKRFLEIQKAYEVLSDPFARTVYDIYGYDGLNLKWPPELRSKSSSELKEVLGAARNDQRRQELEDTIRPKGRVVMGLDASALFDADYRKPGETWAQSLPARLQDVGLTGFSVRHSIQKEVNAKTKLILSNTITQGSPAGLRRAGGHGGIIGTVRHQYSPRLNFAFAASLLGARSLTIKSTYMDPANTVAVQTTLLPSFRAIPPPCTLSYSRRLFRDSLTHGLISLHTGTQPYLSISIMSPTPFTTAPDPSDGMPDNERSRSSLGSSSGFGAGVIHSTYGATLSGVASSLRAEWGVVLSELTAQVSVGIQLGWNGLAGVLSGTWGDEQGGVTTLISLNAAGVELRVELLYLGQQFIVPVTLADEYDASLALFTAALPSTAFVLAYHFILKPRRRRERIAFIRDARKALQQERTEIRREVEETVALLKETARKHTLAEKAKEGLVISEATYGPTDPDPEARDLIIDVTIPMQALVHKSQLYISGHRPKSGLQGFYDPAPTLAKSLRIRYLFNGCEHYAEVPDCRPVVLPLEDHRVGTVG
ncbi:DnaJ-domain-containing protein [Auriscalpium vulgare]|uniref:DnaJ-domain-containing protein n=1 Tax=Auriscalpium vulgare TaxID=40419 RepID=A0ACB8RFD9_9AGAM|nr:DnaJ-domain-containing protein [Auriscalpium vulgare]